ncbi:MAG TPA: efflux RND transporter periplasmic adaptor subunit [Candidatus Sulfotelmatobacter sp.]|nr:efflux RND transporter periplasmic adaptor subunit [Candidatus Sulfotelmatobacter sp.]
MKRKRLRGLIATLAVVLIVGAMIVFALIPSPLTVEVGRVSRGPLQVTIDQEGETRVHDRFVLSSPVIGRLIRIDLDDGDPIRKGQIVARIDPVPLNQREREEVYARVEAAAAALRLATAREAHAREDREQAGRDRERAERLAKEGVISVQALEQARNADVTADDELSAARYGVQVAASEEKVARAGLVSVDTAPGKPRPLIELRSPISGRVLRVVEKSERVVPVGTPILILGEPGQIEVVTDVLSTDAVKIRPGAPVLLDGWGGDHPLRARVRLVEPYGFTKVSALGVEEQRVNVISDFVDPPGPLGDGYRVETHILTWSSENALKMPLSAVFRRGQGWSAFVIAAGRAMMKTVEIGHRNESEVEILGGMAEGEQVILHPPNQLNDGMRVRAE